MHPDLQRHITRTYINLRVGMAAMAFLLPVLLLAGAWASSKFVPQGSISAYYHTPMRNVFVGILIAVGAFLYLYKGFSDKENYALNVAGILAILVALLPTSVPKAMSGNIPAYLPPQPFTAPYPHGVSAVLFFVLIAYVCIFRSHDTVSLIDNAALRTRYTYLYRVYGTLMVVSPIVAAALILLTDRTYLIFAVELAGVWVFAAFWLTKSFEFTRQTQCLEYQVLATGNEGITK